MICPLPARKSPTTDAETYTSECMGCNCAWWDNFHGSCAIISAADALHAINEALMKLK